MPDTDRLSDLHVNEALIYVRERPETPAADDEAISGLAWGPTLRKVEISEVDRLRRQVGWIAGRLAAMEDVDQTFAVDAVTL